MYSTIVTLSHYAIEISELTKRYKIIETKQGEERNWLTKLMLGESFAGHIEVREKVVLDHINLKVKEGECIGLLGPNGAGKSTLLEIISGAVLPDEGKVNVMGCDVVKEREKAKKYLTPILPVLGVNNMWTARQNLEYVALLYNIPKQEMKKRINDVLDRVGLKERADENVIKYSSGMRVRLILAMGLIIDNPVYLMDEPFIGIDPGTAKEIRKFVKNELVEKGRTILLATNMLADVEELCNKVALLNEGKLVVVDTPSNLKKKIKGIETIDLEILTEEDSSIIKALENLNGIKTCLYSSGTSDGLDVTFIKIHTYDSKSLLPSLIHTIHSMNGKIRYVKIYEPTLEDVFIWYTGRRLSE